jgi:hypothetical protein
MREYVELVEDAHNRRAASCKRTRPSLNHYLCSRFNICSDRGSRNSEQQIMMSGTDQSIRC